MDLLYLAGACLCFSFQFVFRKMFQKRTDGTLHASFWGTVINSIAAFAIFFVVGGFRFKLVPSMVIWGLVYAVSSVGSGVSSFLGMTYSKLATVTFYMLLGGMVIPFVYGIAFLDEHPTICQWIGTVVMLISMVTPLVLPGIIKRDNQVEKNQRVLTSKEKAIAVICNASAFLMNGTTSVVTTIAARDPGYEEIGGNGFILITNVLVFAMSIICIPFIMSLLNKKNPEHRFHFLPNDSKTGTVVSFIGLMVLFIISLGFSALNGFGNIFSLQCASMNFPASIQYPTISAACIALSAVFGFIIFKEKPSFAELMGIGISLVGIVLYMF